MSANNLDTICVATKHISLKVSFLIRFGADHKKVNIIILKPI